jgi:hypothetical protein
MTESSSIAFERGPSARAQILFEGLRIIRRHDGSLRWRELAELLPARLPEGFVEAERAKNDGKLEDYMYGSFYAAAKAGWLERKGGTWTLSTAGEAALDTWTDASTLRQHARAAAGLGDTDEVGPLPYLGEVNDWYGQERSIFSSGHATVGQLVSSVEQGTLALPDIQRPFVWKNTKVRDLLDSMFRGYPIGYLLTWNNPGESGTRGIGTEAKGASVPSALVIDGQQRLTSLFAVMTGRPVLDAKFRERKIRIGFQPIEGRFEVAGSAIKNNPEWLPDVSAVFSDPRGPSAVSMDYLRRLEDTREIDDEHRLAAQNNIMRLSALRDVQLGTLEIGANASEEVVAEIFVRINSQGQKLKQADFILTLLSVCWDEGREELEAFARACVAPPKAGEATAFNYQLHPGPEDLLRVVIAVSHRRARLSAAYQVLRGRDPETRRVTVEARDRNVALLQGAQPRVLDVGLWKEYLKCLASAGYRSKELITSRITALYGYGLFLIGRNTFGLPLEQLRSAVGRYFIMSALTGRFTGGSAESEMEQDLARLRGLPEGDGPAFLRALSDIVDSELTDDFWSVTLPSRLESSNPRTAMPFYAAQCALGTKALFSDLPIESLIDPALSGDRKGVEGHHLFPKAWLRRNGFDSTREYNQVANFTLVEWSDNSSIADRAPAEYVPKYEARLDPARLEDAYRLHALPTEWWKLDYPEFLVERRRLMARVVRDAFDRLG